MDAHPDMHKIEEISYLKPWLNDIKNLTLPWRYFSFEKDNSFNNDIPHREEILDYGDQGFLIRNLLSPKECQQLIENSESIGYSDLPPNFPDYYRSNKRIMALSDSLSQTLYERVTPFLKPITITGDTKKDRVLSISKDLQGVWEPFDLNPLFRICRYYPGQHFAPHYDDFLDREDSTDRSHQTLMLYLNGPLDGGSTNFLNESIVSSSCIDDNGRLVAQEDEIEYRVEPQEGLGIIFNHYRLHEGEVLRSGVKYILRSDILFTKVQDNNDSY